MSRGSPRPAPGAAAPRRVTAILLGILLLGTAARLYLVNEPLFGVRQTDTAAVARNFYEEEMNLFYPRVDWRGSTPGYAETEFPIYGFAIAVLYHLFGVQEWLGRLFNIGVYALSALLLFRLAGRLFGPPVGLLAAGFYSVFPLGYMYTLTYQPDALMALGSLAGVYGFWVWTEDESRGALVGSAAATLLAVLVKPTSLYLGLPVLYLAHRRFGWGLFRQRALWLFAAAILLPAVLWLHHAWSLWDVYGNTFGILGGWNKIGLPEDRAMWVHLVKALWRRLLFWIATPGGVLLLALGFVRRVPGGNYLLHAWAVGFGVSTLLAAEAHLAHNHYQLPGLFPVAAWMAWGAAWMWERPARWPWARRAAVVGIVLSVVAVSAREFHSGWLGSSVRIPPRERRRIAFAAEVRRLTEPEAKVIFVTPYRGKPSLYQHRTPEGEFLDCDPMDFYHSHRKGWSLDERQATPEFVETLRGRGARYLATPFPELLEKHPDLEAALDSSYVPLDSSLGAIYRLDPAGGS